MKDRAARFRKLDDCRRLGLVIALLGTGGLACSNSGSPPDAGGVVNTGMWVFPTHVNRNVDILFMVDNSTSMRPMQAKMNAQLPAFMQVLQTLPGGLPDLHVGVVSSSMGGGIYSDVPTCFPDTPMQDDGGKLQFAARPATGQTSCPTPNDGDHYIKANADGTTDNFGAGSSLADVLGCIAFLGDRGCGFEQPFASVQRALEKAQDPNDADNGGFLRDNAYLAVVMLTNEDDCSVPRDSDLFATDQYDLSAIYGPPTSYRCNEFGHLCTYPDGHVGPPPRTLPNGEVTMQKCVSAADAGGDTNKLTKVQDLVDFLKSLKPNPANLLVAVIGTMVPGATSFPLAPYVVTTTDNVVPDPSLPSPARHEQWPSVKPGCTNPDGSFGDPSPRHEMLVRQFGENGLFSSICDNDYRSPMMTIARAIGSRLGPPCIAANLESRPDGTPDCLVAAVTLSDNGTPISRTVPNCNTGKWCGNTTCTHADASADKPCWDLSSAIGCADGQTGLLVCRDPTCDPSIRPTNDENISVTCSLTP